MKFLMNKTGLYLLIVCFMQIVFESNSHAQTLQNLQEGTYLGKSLTEKNSQSGEYLLMVKKVAERQGSFLAVILQREKFFTNWRITNNMFRLYLIDPIGSKQMLVPLHVTSYGDIGKINENPSLVLTSQVADKKFILSNSQTNGDGLQGAFEFDLSQCDNDVTWTALKSGTYKDGNIQLSVGDYADDSRDYSVSIADNENSSYNSTGTLSMREKLKHIYTLHAHRYFATGKQTSSKPSSVIISINNKGTRDTKLIELKGRDINIYDGK